LHLSLTLYCLTFSILYSFFFFFFLSSSSFFLSLLRCISYEWGWGQSFHFAPGFQNESFNGALARHEHFLALRLNLKAGEKALDAGCGVGGPMRSIARFSGAKVIGVNNNAYQVQRCNQLNQQQKLDHLCRAQKGNFMDLTPFDENSFDGVYAIEATCHAPDKTKCFEQIFRVLKPGRCFVGYEWVMTDLYDEKNAEHRLLKHNIEKGDGLPDLARDKDVDAALRAAGFELITAYDLAEEAKKNGNEVEWYDRLAGGCWPPSKMKYTRTGIKATEYMVAGLEKVGIAPKGTTETHRMLACGAEGLVAGGRTGTFTPMYFFMARKPANGAKAAASDDHKQRSKKKGKK
jgi:sterol 24-C-methyltransferase